MVKVTAQMHTRHQFQGGYVRKSAFITAIFLSYKISEKGISKRQGTLPLCLSEPYCRIATPANFSKYSVRANGITNIHRTVRIYRSMIIIS